MNDMKKSLTRLYDLDIELYQMESGDHWVLTLYPTNRIVVGVFDNEEDALKAYYDQYVVRAKLFEMVGWELTFEEFVKILNQPCDCPDCDLVKIDEDGIYHKIVI